MNSVLLLLLSVAAARVLYTRTENPIGWTRQARVQGDRSVSFAVALKQRNLDKLENLYWAVSDPKHPDYQNFMSIEEINELVSPPRAQKQVVHSWLSSCAKSIKDFGDAFEAVATAACAETLFNTHMYEFTHSETGARVVRQWGEVSLPAHVSPLVDLVEGLSNFPVPHLRHMKPAQKKAGEAQDAVIAQTLYSLYNVPSTLPNLASSATQSTIQFDNQNFDPDELAAYGQQVGQDIQTISTIVGNNNPSNPGDESQMDVEMMGSINTVTDTWFWIEPSTSWLYLFSVHFMNTANVPQIASISYGWSEMNECDINPTECHKLGINSEGYVDRTNVEFQKIGLRGVTLVAASADSGANGRTDEQCTLTYLKPAFPACSPYVTSVGATQVDNAQYNLPNPPSACNTGDFNCISGGDEVAVSYNVSGFASGGGFSVFSPQPSFQTAAVNAYLNSNPPHLPPKTYYNGTNRGYPDVASLGHNCLVLESDQLQAAGGTSCSAPSFAAIVGILNQVAIDVSGKALGPLAPLLYQMYADDASTFNDITVGDNHCTEQGCKPKCKGFWCAPGWDPVTGLGSPNVSNMITYLQNNLKRKSSTS